MNKSYESRRKRNEQRDKDICAMFDRMLNNDISYNTTIESICAKFYISEFRVKQILTKRKKRLNGDS